MSYRAESIGLKLLKGEPISMEERIWLARVLNTGSTFLLAHAVQRKAQQEVVDSDSAACLAKSAIDTFNARREFQKFMLEEA